MDMGSGSRSHKFWPRCPSRSRACPSSGPTDPVVERRAPAGRRWCSAACARLRRGRRGRRRRPRHRRRRVLHDARALGLGQDDAAADDRGLRAARRRDDRAGRRRRDARAALRAQRQHRLPGLRAVPAHERARERRVRPARAARRARGAPPPRARPRSRWCACRVSARASRSSSRAASASASRSPARSSTSREVLLLDEPLGALDLKLRQEMQLELKRIQREVGITFIFVTHDQEEALTMSDRLVVLNHGQDRAARHPGRGLRAPGERVRRRLHRRLEPARARRPAVHDPPREGPPARARRAARRPAATSSAAGSRT